MPLVTVRSSPKGLPIATTGSPTSAFEESPSGSGVAPWVLSTWRRARSLEGSAPTTAACWLSPSSLNLTSTRWAPSTTCALVRMWPSPSIRKPDPVAVLCCSWGRLKGVWVVWVICELMKATPLEARS